MHFLEILKAIFFGIVEGITEWLPISSTGHMILLDEFVKLDVSEGFLELYLVVIQLGAILAVPILFFDKLNPFSKGKSEVQRRATLNLWGKAIVGAVPAAIIGVLFDDFFDEHFYNYIVVSIALIVYGVAFILVEKLISKKSAPRVMDVSDLTYKDALFIGAFQILALVPGTSRSGSTILGGIVGGISRTASAEFSFFVAIPVMVGASLLKIVKFLSDGLTATGNEILLLSVGMLTSFVVSYFAIKFLMDFVKRHDFSPFGIYRIILGILVLGYFLTRALAF